MLHTRTSRRNLADCWTRAAKLLSIPPALSISQWAERYRYLSPEASSRPGKWASLPMQVEPMDAALDPDVESLCLMWASQAAGKTEIILNIQGYFIARPMPAATVADYLSRTQGGQDKGTRTAIGDPSGPGVAVR